MRKIVKGILGVVGGLLLVGIGGVVVKFYALSPKVRPAAEMHAPTDPASIEHGKYLARYVMQCTTCHSEIVPNTPGDVPVEASLGKGRFMANIKGMGKICASNITPDKETGVGNMTDGELVRSMREGIGKNGNALNPLMPYASWKETLSDSDALAIVAYLKTIPAIKNEPCKSELDFPLSLIVRILPAPVEKAPPPAPVAGIERGKWLLKVAQCETCHNTFDDHHQPVPGHYLAGAMPFDLENGSKVYAPNLTADPATGIGRHSDDDLMKAFDKGVSKDGRPLYEMPWAQIQKMTDDDKKAIILALRQVPAVNHTVPKNEMK
ncbi:hypothetical protein LVJ94_30245 [Pendulispora rubella]|uniref:Cytochrome c domain-containing protein n=1 Tax=Pendulispora rubella TaxID=2741070 RepID=A0ABZ2KRA7_9BACT